MAEEGGFEFEDSESYKKGEDKLSVRQIILKQLQKCMTEGSKEMTRGGTVKKIMDGRLIEESIPNQRELFINSVEMLKIPLLKRFQSYISKKDDNEIKKLFESTESKLKELKEEHSKIRKDIIYSKNKPAHSEAVNNKLGLIYNEFEIEKVEIYKQLLIAITYLLDEEHYFEEESATAGV